MADLKLKNEKKKKKEMVPSVELTWLASNSSCSLRNTSSHRVFSTNVCCCAVHGAGYETSPRRNSHFMGDVIIPITQG